MMRFTGILLSSALVAALGVASPMFSSAFAQEAAEAPAAAKATLDEKLFDVPEDESSEFYLNRLQELQKNLSEYFRTETDRDAIQSALAKFNDAMKVIQRKLAFADDVDENVSLNMFQTYTIGLAREGKLDDLKALLKSESAKEGDAVKARVSWLRYLTHCVSLDQAEESAALKDAIKALEADLATDDLVAQHIEEFVQIVEAHDPEESSALFERTRDAFSKSDSSLRKAIAKSLEGRIRFKTLVGKDMLVEGVWLDKTEIDWKSFRGKVVLVDFWATWCGPCLGEIPNVEELYKKYHEAGFEVIGYSIDDDIEALEKFEEERKLPWKTASRYLTRQANENDGKEYTIMSEYYGVNAIPTMILVGRDGKVIDTHARGAHLKELLEQEFPSDEEEK